jgi:NUMOD4 motif-containing protein/HNH endonuclease
MNAPSARGLDQEAWMGIPDWSFYEVSNLGRVRRKAGTPKCRNVRILKSHINDNGYPTVHLRQDGAEKQMQIHIAVALAFLGEKPTPSHEVAHGDGDELNACLSNLRWATHAENEADKIIHGTRLYGEVHPSARLTNDEVSKVRELRHSGKTYSEISDELPVSRAHACRIVNGQRRAA